MVDNIKSIGPLEGIRVVEVGTLIAAPFATRLLGEFGADVIKIEAKDGDPLRKWRMLKGDTSLWWYVQSRNKRVMTLDLKSCEGQDIARRLIQNADVLVENFRPGALERLGLGWDDLRAINPNQELPIPHWFQTCGAPRERWLRMSTRSI